MIAETYDFFRETSKRPEPEARPSHFYIEPIGPPTAIVIDP